MTKAELVRWLVRHGYKADKYGHYQKKSSTGIKLRFKLQATSARYEHQIVFDDGGKEWLRIRSGYYSKLRLSQEDKLQGMYPSLD